MSEKTIEQCKDKIIAIWGPPIEDGGGPLGASVGNEGVTEIVAYGDVGQMAYVPWFIVRKGGKHYRRYNAAHITEVEYADDES